MSDTKDTKKHANDKTWQKGQSGNPGGRSPRVGPNGETVAELARAHTATAIQCLVDVCAGKVGKIDKDTGVMVIEARDRIAAANALLDRGWGKPKESVDVDARIEGGAVPVIQFVRAPDPDPPS